jgi:hypothetical protein
LQRPYQAAPYNLRASVRIPARVCVLTCMK